MEARLQVASPTRDPTSGQLAFPFLHAALPQPRYAISDPRLTRPGVYGADCMAADAYVLGVGSAWDANNIVTTPGRVNGTLVVEIGPSTSQVLTSVVFAILAAEIVRPLSLSLYHLVLSSQLTLDCGSMATK